MIEERNYNADDLLYGICEMCGEESNEIDPKTGWCVDCVEAARFYEETMKYEPKYPAVGIDVGIKNYMSIASANGENIKISILT